MTNRPIRGVHLSDEETEVISRAYLTIANAIQRANDSPSAEISMTGVVVEMKIADVAGTGPLSFSDTEITEVVSRINAAHESHPPDDTAEMAMMVVLMGHIRSGTDDPTVVRY